MSDESKKKDEIGLVFEFLDKTFSKLPEGSEDKIRRAKAYLEGAEWDIGKAVEQRKADRKDEMRETREWISGIVGGNNPEL